MCFNLGIRLVDFNSNSTSTCISIRTFDRSTAILIQTLYCYKVTCSSASLCIAMPCCCLFSPALMLFSWLTTMKLLIYLVSVAAEASHIGGTAPVRELFIDENFLVTVCFMFYFHLLLNWN